MEYGKGIAYSFLLVLALCNGCEKKEITDNDPQLNVSPTTGTRMQFTIDSIYLYAQQIYLWNDALPDYKTFSPREKYDQISPEFTAFKSELYDISQLKINAITGVPYEEFSNSTPKYSFIEGGAKTLHHKRGFDTGDFLQAAMYIEINSKKIGYLALGSFPALSDSRFLLDKVFASFASRNTEYLVLDLRYNAGGYVETAEYLANLIATKSLTGKIMYTESFNQQLQSGKANILKHQLYLDEEGNTVDYNGRVANLNDVDFSEIGNTYRFDKKGNLDSIKEIYVIVSRQTASASELLISCLKPYFKVQLIGERTFGKPVGSFGIKIDQYIIYLSSFLIKNAESWSDYFDGIPADIPVDLYSGALLGDPYEVGLNTAISNITSNDRSQLKIDFLTPKKPFDRFESSSITSGHQFSGAQESRVKLKTQFNIRNKNIISIKAGY